MLVEREGRRVVVRSNDKSRSWYFYDGDKFDEHRINRILEYAQVEYLKQLYLMADKEWEQKYE